MLALDTGPIFKFLATHNERMLFKVTGGPIHLSQAVIDEVLYTPRRRPQFGPAVSVFEKVKGRFVVVLEDDEPYLDALAREVFQQPLVQLRMNPENLGEQMTLLHGVEHARRGHQVRIVCDDGPACRLISARAQHHVRAVSAGTAPEGSGLRLDGTISLLGEAIDLGLFADRGVLKTTYAAMAGLDSALPGDIDDTGLLMRFAAWKATHTAT